MSCRRMRRRGEATLAATLGACGGTERRWCTDIMSCIHRKRKTIGNHESRNNPDSSIRHADRNRKPQEARSRRQLFTNQTTPALDRHCTPTCTLHVSQWVIMS
jgi:hypothetical protein